MEKQDTLISVCVPVYNGESTIEETINAIVNQTYKNIEIIVVDNCSTDNTVSILKKIKDERIRVFINDENLGMVGNWNQCLKYVTGQYVHFVCADDLLSLDCIQKKVDILMKHNEVSMVISASELINDNNQILLQRNLFKKDTICNGKKLAKKSFYTRNLYGEPSNVLFKTSAIKQVGDFAMNTCYSTDWDMWIRLSCTGDVAYINEYLMKYRVATGNETSRIGIKKIIQDDRAMVSNVLSYRCLKVNKIDIVIHRLMILMRAYARIIYMKFFANK